MDQNKLTKELLLNFKPDGNIAKIQKAPIEIAKLLVKYTSFKNLKFYVRCNLIFLYNPSTGIYDELKLSELEVKLKRLLQVAQYPPIESSFRLKRIIDDLKTEESVAQLGDVKFDKHIIIFQNCAFNLQTMTSSEWSPEFFVNTRLPFGYDPQAQCPNFHLFLKKFSEGHDDRIQFLRAYLKATVMSNTSFQMFLYILGKGATGKSTFGHIASALVGDRATLATSLRSLHLDPFEIYNLMGKKLILINDTENYRGDISVLKQLVGGDAMRGRMKFVQGSFNVEAEGMLLILGNHPLGIKDASDAIHRRMRTFKVSHVFEERDIVLSSQNGQWVGSIGQELPGIFNWVLKMDDQLVYDYLVHTVKKVPSMKEVIMESQENLNPLLSWIKEELVPGPGSFFGFKSESGLRGQIESARRKALYPVYETWCRKQGFNPLSHKAFSNILVDSLRSCGYDTANKVRRTEGMYISGVVPNPIVFTKDYLMGATLSETNKEPSQAPYQSGQLCILQEIPDSLESCAKAIQTLPYNYDNPKSLQSLFDVDARRRNRRNPRISPNLYLDYAILLGHKSPSKQFMNTWVKKHFSDNGKFILSTCLSEYMAERPLSSEVFRAKVQHTLDKGIKRIARFGGIPFSYKIMGTSPRILPVSYGNTINSTKKVLRSHCYQLMGQVLYEKEKKVIIDFDLVSCYTSIVMGLYRQELQALDNAMKGPGIWEHIKQEFIRKGQGSSYSKPAVKICVYSSFFGGGPAAMIDGIIESFRLDCGQSLAEFKDNKDFEECYNLARRIADEMKDSSIIFDFRHVAEVIFNSYLEEGLLGPTGHHYMYSRDTFRNAYPDFLQSYELCLLAQAAIETVIQFPEVEIIGHFHDGNVLCIPESIQSEVVTFISDRVTSIGQDLGLSYPQVLEMKKVFPSER